jgi:hypothetical protein
MFFYGCTTTKQCARAQDIATECPKSAFKKSHAFLRENLVKASTMQRRRVGLHLDFEHV